MNAFCHQHSPAAELTPEWERLQLLGYCLSKARQDSPLEADELERLKNLQSEVFHLREQGNVWQQVMTTPLSHLEVDILACVLAPEFEPGLGWMYQNLQSSTAQPYPSRALIQELLALGSHQAENLHRALSPGAALRSGHMINMDREDPYSPMRPEPWLVSRLLGRTAEVSAPPGSLAVMPLAGWEDLVLPSSRLTMLREYLFWIEHRETVVHQWGGQMTGGPVTLFVGPSGTGKTLAARVVAGILNWPLFRVDLGRLVSKYIGETEKNLNRLFDAAHGRQMVLQFDEADALFSKRGEVKEARDRYANMEVSHLLNRIEIHDGPCILTSNLRKQMDTAFLRRFHVVVEFPRPDAEARSKLWQMLLPPRAPVAPEVDPAELGRAVSLTGGGIRNAALHASYLAAAEGASIHLHHLALAVWRELSKEGKEVHRYDLGLLAKHLPQGIDDEP